MPSWLTLTNIWLYNMTSMKQLSATEKQQHAMYDFWSSSHAMAMADLVLALARDTSKTVERGVPSATPNPSETAALATACQFMERLCILYVHPLLPREMPRNAQVDHNQQLVLQSPSLMPSTALMLAAVAYTWPEKK